MATTKNTYTGNGSTAIYAFTFPYLEVNDIVVTVDGAVQTIPTQYILSSPTTISFTTPPTSGSKIIIRRVSSDEDLNAIFFPGSAIRARDLNENFQQLLYVAQETQTRADESSSDSSAAEEAARQAAESAAEAQEDAAEALVAANQANQSASQAASSAANAEASAQAAQEAAQNVEGAADEAVATANEALVKANAADTKADTALSKATTAETNSNQALSLSTAANTNALNALSTANSANAKSDAAVKTADEADENADLAIVIATNALTIADGVAQSGEPFGQLYNVSPGAAGSKVINLGDLAPVSNTGHFPNEDQGVNKYTCSEGTGTFDLGVAA